jgi:hypothetical protein
LLTCFNVLESILILFAAGTRGFSKKSLKLGQIFHEVLSNLSGKLVVLSGVTALAAHISYRDASLCKKKFSVNFAIYGK